jgi:hypothetical protein
MRRLGFLVPLLSANLLFACGASGGSTGSGDTAGNGAPTRTNSEGGSDSSGPPLRGADGGLVRCVALGATIACGAETCAAETEYCNVVTCTPPDDCGFDGGYGRKSYTCTPLPDACKACVACENPACTAAAGAACTCATSDAGLTMSCLSY